MRTALTILAVLILAAAAPSQESDPTKKPSAWKPSDLCTVEGLAAKATTGEPVKKAVVEIYSVERNWRSSTSTEADGRFQFTDIEPGRYRLRARATGFLLQVYGQRTVYDGGTEVVLAPGQHRRDILFRLMPAGVIAGRIYDGDGDPVVGATVSALRYAYFNSRRQLLPVGQVQTNDLGEYRVYGLGPGQYTVMANYRGSDEAPQEIFLPTFYGDTADPGQASWLRVGPGEEILEINITFTTGHAVCVRGTVTNLTPSKGRTIPYIRLVPRATAIAEQLLNGRYAAGAQNDKGEFQICGVPPGVYFAYAHHVDGEQQYVGRSAVDVGTTEVDGVTIALGSGFEIRGRVRTDPPAPLDFTKLSVWLRATDNSSVGGAGGDMKPDGTFVLHNVYEGTYRLQVAGFPEEFYVKSANLGGVDVLETGLGASSSESSTPLDVVLSSGGGRIDGIVLHDQKPAGEATVIFVPDAARSNRDELYSMTGTDPLGRFSLLGLPPGDFTLYAFEKLEDESFKSPDFLEFYADRGVPVHIEEEQQQAVQLELILGPEKLY